MAQLNSPGVAVTVVDESFYTPAAPSTVPLIIVASQENKPNGANTGIAPGTLKANAGLAYLITSQRDLAETFGIPIFKTDANNNPIHAGEQNEYGLQAAYSYLGVSNRAYVVRADIDLGALNPKADAPKADPLNGTHWLDTANSSWGVFEWNGDAKGTGKGQTWTKKTPIVISDTTKVVDYSIGDYTPKGSVGAVGDYAIVSLMNLDTSYSDSDVLWFKSAGNTDQGIAAGEWVQVGSEDWYKSWPVLVSTLADIDAAKGKDLTIDGTTITLPTPAPGTPLTALTVANTINSTAGFNGVSAGVRNNRLVIFANNDSFEISNDAVPFLGLDEGTYYRPALAIQPHTSVPSFKTADNEPRPTGSLWIKTTEATGGAKLIVKKYNEDNDSFELMDAPLLENGHSAIYKFDRAGGINIPVGTLYTKTNLDEGFASLDFDSPDRANFTIYRKRAAGSTTITSKVIGNSTFSIGLIRIDISESLAGQKDLSPNKAVTANTLGNDQDAELIASAINRAGFINITASVDSKNRVVISHKLGGDFRMNDSGFISCLAPMFGGTTNPSLFLAPGSSGYDYVASQWEPLRFTASKDAPTSLTKNGTLWYSSVVDEVDIMIHDGNTWVGYANGVSNTDPLGPLVGATPPVLQSDGSQLEDGDLWIDTSDLENYPKIHRFDATKTTPIATRWVLLDNTDQSTEDGVLFADARWNTDGQEGDATIVELLTSDHLDPDAPDPALYPKGMLLWNMRRSGFNVKEFKQNYINLDATNPRITVLNINGDPENPLMDDYYPHRWVTVSGNQQNGAGNFGRMAQRRVVVQSLQAVTNSSRDIREEARVFNLLACPGYPELIGELISLNFDRALTAFIVGDTPARLTPDSTSLKAWGDNLRLAVEDNDFGGASYDEYLGMFYPWGFTSDNFGNNVVVPPSHMMLRTIALSDSVSYPWFAPAGTRRGGITNATNVGYVDKEGEFVVVALSNAARDTLYEVKINPITFFTGVGLVNYGQKTRAKAASALDRINVARLVIYLRRQLDILAKPYIFEPNDKITRDQIRSACESLMLELVGQRALYDYIVVCDESNNTPARIDKNELYVDIAIEPVKAVEFIYIPLRLKNTGEIAGL
jgi:hypothetical protein